MWRIKGFAGEERLLASVSDPAGKLRVVTGSK